MIRARIAPHGTCYIATYASVYVEHRAPAAQIHDTECQARQWVEDEARAIGAEITWET